MTSPLNSYYTLGRTGLRVSRLALGTMTFGTEWGWGSDKETARQLFNAYADAGGNFFDTADLYTNGTSETWLGEFVAERGLRDKAVIATKFTYNGEPGNPNAGGNGRKNILRAVEGSLKRLGTDYIDLYILHTWDRVTPAEEVMRTLDDLVRAGKIRHAGLSDVPAWYASRAQTLADWRGYEPISALQSAADSALRDGDTLPCTLVRLQLRGPDGRRLPLVDLMPPLKARARRGGDRLARAGSHGFVLWLAHTDAEAAAGWARELRADLAPILARHALHCSIGLATEESAGAPLQQLWQRAAPPEGGA